MINNQSSNVVLFDLYICALQLCHDDNDDTDDEDTDDDDDDDDDYDDNDDAKTNRLITF